MLQDAFEALDRMPTNEEIKKRAAPGGPNQPTPVKDLWQFFNLSKRVECCEDSIDKLTTLIEDVLKENSNFKEAMIVIADAVDEVEWVNRFIIIEIHLPVPILNLNFRCAVLSGKTTCFTSIQAQTNNPFTVVAQDNNRDKPSVSFQREDATSGGTNTNTNNTTAAATAATTSKCLEGPCLEDKNGGKDGQTSSGNKNQTGGQDTEGDENQKSSEGLNSNVNSEGNIVQQIGIGPEFFKMPAPQKFCVLKGAIDCLIHQFKNFNETLPVNQIASKVSK